MCMTMEQYESLKVRNDSEFKIICESQKFDEMEAWQLYNWFRMYCGYHKRDILADTIFYDYIDKRLKDAKDRNEAFLLQEIQVHHLIYAEQNEPEWDEDEDDYWEDEDE